MRVRKKPTIPEITQAHQWRMNGDHPNDDCSIDENGKYSEGRVVRYWRHPGAQFSGAKWCPNCDHTYHYHGFIDSHDTKSEPVCPGDWILGDKNSGYVAVSEAAFERDYEPCNKLENEILDKFEPVDKEVKRYVNDHIITPVHPPITPAPIPEFTPVAETHCSKCQRNFSGVTGYVCNHTDCPMGLGSPTCVINASYISGATAGDTTVVRDDDPNTFSTSDGDTEGTRV